MRPFPFTFLLHTPFDDGYPKLHGEIIVTECSTCVPVVCKLRCILIKVLTTTRHFTTQTVYFLTFSLLDVFQ